MSDTLAMDFSSVDLSAPPAINDWEKLGLDHKSSKTIGPMLSPKAARAIIHGEEIRKILHDVVQDNVTFHGTLISDAYSLQKLFRNFARQTLERIAKEEQTHGINFILYLEDPKMTVVPYVMIPHANLAMCIAAFNHQDCGTSVVFCSSEAAMNMIRKHGVRSPMPLACANCGLGGAGLKKCARCRTVRYCSEECQKKDWAAHKAACCMAKK